MKPERRTFYLERLRTLARRHGGTLLSRRYVDDTTKLRFRCAQGHTWMQTPGGVKMGKWCTLCGRARRDALNKAPAIARLHRLVARRGGVVLSKQYVNSQTKLLYRCREGHEWSAVPNSIAVGQWCPVCAKVSRMRTRGRHVYDRLSRIVKRHRGKILTPEFPGSKTALRFRCAQGHTWEARAESIDEGVWCPTCNRDSVLAEFRAIARSRGGTFTSRSYRNHHEPLRWRCALGHRWQASGNSVKQGTWCARCHLPGFGNIERMRQTARERGGECLSRKYVDADTKLRWRCRDGHGWESDPGSIVQGTWCPVCRVRDGHSTSRLSLEDMRATAAERGGKCLSENYQASLVRLRWRCARGHEWMALPWQVRQGNWCPRCSHSARGTVAGMQELAMNRGGRCLTRTWNNHRETLLFECGRGHRFRALGVVIKSGVWCPQCRK